MKFQFIFPRWPKLAGQTPFTLPPLGMIQAAASVPADVDVGATDENVQDVSLDGEYDLVGISIMLTCQAPRAYELAAEFRRRGKPVVLGGLHVALCPEEAAEHADAIVVGEGEGLIEQLVADFQRGAMRPRYDRDGFVDITTVPNPRRDLYDKGRFYTYKDWELVDLVETSRGCTFNCYPCCTPYLGGRQHRIRPLDRVLSDIESCGDTLFIVDNSLEQNVEYEKTLFRAMAGMGKSWVSHPISCEPEVLKLAADAGCWYVYHAIYTISDKIRDRIRMYHDHGIGVEGTILLGLDDHDEDFIHRF
ncbi:MAG: radical SAM protein, partial [bacterium]